MKRPKITFFCELDAVPLSELFSDPAVIEDLNFLEAEVSLGILDLSPERAQIVKRLNEAGIPVTAWLLLPRQDGYWFNLQNAPLATARYAAFKKWTAQHQLHWTCIGLDIEPDIQEAIALKREPQKIVPVILKRIFNRTALLHAKSTYLALVDRMRLDGYRTESYHLPVLIDERKAGSTLLQRLAGIVDFPADREVFMLYSSFLRPDGAGALWNYAHEAQAVGIGSTGGGVDIEGISDIPPLSWHEFRRDLLLAHHLKKDIYVFSLEGCVKRGFLTHLKNFDWDQSVEAPLASARKTTRIRRLLSAVLWASAHPLLISGVFLTLILLSWHLRRKRIR